FGEQCKFGEWCIFGGSCEFGEACKFGKGCELGEVCIFGGWCIFDERCRFGEWCKFGERCIFGEWCRLEGVVNISNTIYITSGFGSENRTTYAIPHANGIKIRCGCWVGEIEDFRARVKNVYKNNPIKLEYLLMADMFEARR